MDLLHVFKQGDPVLIAAFLILVIMSLATWTVMIVRTIKLRRAKKANARVKDRIWGAKSWEDAIRIARENEDAPMSKQTNSSIETKIPIWLPAYPSANICCIRSITTKDRLCAASKAA